MCLHPPVCYTGAAEKWVLQEADKAEGQRSRGTRSGPTGKGVWGRSGGNTFKDHGQGPCCRHQLRQGRTQRGPHKHRKHIPAWLLATQSQEIIKTATHTKTLLQCDYNPIQKHWDKYHLCESDIYFLLRCWSSIEETSFQYNTIQYNAINYQREELNSSLTLSPNTFEVQQRKYYCKPA